MYNVMYFSDIAFMTKFDLQNFNVVSDKNINSKTTKHIALISVKLINAN